MFLKLLRDTGRIYEFALQIHLSLRESLMIKELPDTIGCAATKVANYAQNFYTNAVRVSHGLYGFCIKLIKAFRAFFKISQKRYSVWLRKCFALDYANSVAKQLNLFHRQPHAF
jgi:hypothetical protein